MPRVWRALRDGPAPGAWNMGVDEALLATAMREGRATLRFYRWEGHWLSLGCSQVLDPAREDACRAGGVSLVRRATGGRAVLHGSDLTYALAAPAGLLPSGLSATYQCVNRALATALAGLGVDVDASCSSARAPGREVFDCFAQAAAHELVAGGRKLAGSAQRRAGGAVLQHGSIRLSPEPEPVRAAAGLVVGAATSLRELGFQGSLAALQDACVAALAEALDARFEPGALEPIERATARDRSAQAPVTTAQFSRQLSGSR
jgi:lipoate-protein ligase A